MTRPAMRLLSMLLALTAVAFLFSSSTSAGATGSHLNIIEIKDSINPGVEDFIRHAIDRSEEDGAQCLILLLDTPGGLVTAMRGITQAILNARLPIVIYVSPQGAQAASAGVFITVAADIAAMAPGTNIGAAHPVTSGGENVPSTMEEKVVNDLVAFARSLAAQRGRNEQWLEEAVRKSVSITAEEALERNVIDLVAADLPTLLKKLHGWELRRGAETVSLKTEGIEQRVIHPGWQHKVLRVLSNPNIAYILLMIGLAGLYFELSQPGAILPGVVGGVALILALYAMQTLPVNVAGILLILLAVIFFILEIKVASYGMLSIAGVISLVLGSLMLFRFPGEAQGVAWTVLWPTVGAVSLFFATVTTLAARAQSQKPQTGAEALIGLEGVVVEDLAPEGKVFVYGEHWNAAAETGEKIEAGARVRVISLENLKLKVKRIGVR